MKKLKEIGFTLVIVASMVGSLFCINQIATARATPAGCQDDFWFVLLQSTRRLICDGPMQPDGSWNRMRVRYTPRHYVPITTNCYRYSCTSYGGYWVDYSEAENIIYPVNPNAENKPLPDEPGYLGDATASLHSSAPQVSEDELYDHGPVVRR